MIVDKNNPSISQLVVKEKGGFLVCELKCLLDTGSCSAIIALKNGLLSLGFTDMVINTSIGSEERRVEEFKISLLEATSQTRNVRT